MSNVVLTIVSVVAAVNLLLTLAAIRRVNELADRTSETRAVRPVPGTAVAEFSVRDTTGAALTLADVGEDGLRVAFLLAGCAPCKEVEASLADIPADQGALVVAVNGRANAPDVLEIIAGLPRHARVVVGADVLRMATAFSVSAYPTVLYAADGVVRVAAASILASGPAPKLHTIVPAPAPA